MADSEQVARVWCSPKQTQIQVGGNISAKKKCKSGGEHAKPPLDAISILFSVLLSIQPQLISADLGGGRSPAGKKIWLAGL